MTRLGGVVKCAGASFQIISQANPSGYWALPVDGGPAVRLLVSRGEWRHAREQNPRLVRRARRALKPAGVLPLFAGALPIIPDPASERMRSWAPGPLHASNAGPGLLVATSVLLLVAVALYLAWLENRH